MKISYLAFAALALGACSREASESIPAATQDELKAEQAAGGTMISSDELPEWVKQRDAGELNLGFLGPNCNGGSPKDLNGNLCIIRVPGVGDFREWRLNWGPCVGYEAVRYAQAYGRPVEAIGTHKQSGERLFCVVYP